MAKTRETVRGMTDGQRSDIIATMVGAIPSLDFDQAQAIIGKKGPFVADIGEVCKRHAGQSSAAHPSTEFTIHGRTYELVPILKKGESSVSGDTMVARAKELDANLGEEEGAFILVRQNEIPQEFSKEFYLVFTAWRDPYRPLNVTCLRWFGARWFQGRSWLGNGWREGARLVRRVK